MYRGHIFDIQRFSVDDGDGIRTTVFLKGCSLNCLWCHNPESISRNTDIFWDERKCVGCGNCFSVCPAGAVILLGENKYGIDRDRCIRCGRCAKICSADARITAGYYMDSVELLEVLLQDQAYFQKSGGGVTFSGGEPFLQPDFLREMLELCKSHQIATAVDTAGNVPFPVIQSMINYIDLFLFDLKSIDTKVHSRLTGADNKRILKNLTDILDFGARVIIRVPVIPGYNWDAGEIRNLCRFLQTLDGISAVELLQYHEYGNRKRSMLSKSCIHCDPQNHSTIEQLYQALKETGISTIIRREN